MEKLKIEIKESTLILHMKCVSECVYVCVLG